MVEIRFEVETPLSPERVLAAAVDFSQARPEIWSGMDRKRYQVHEVRENTAEVTEGGREFGGIWARERYDWSEPGTVIAQVQDSNVFRSGSRWELRIHPTPAGGSRVEWTSSRRPRGLKGSLLVLALRIMGRRHLRGYLQKTLARLEAGSRGSSQR